MARKKKTRQRHHLEDAEGQDAADELTALQAIFPDIQIDSDDKGFRLVVCPHRGDTETSLVSVTLHIRLRPPQSLCWVGTVSWKVLLAGLSRC